MFSTVAGYQQGQGARYDAVVQGFGLGFDAAQRRPLYAPWGGATPCTVFMYDPAGALGLPTTLTAQPGGWNLIAYTTWTAFSSGVRTNVVSGRGDWALFPGGTTVIPDPAAPELFPLGTHAISGKNAAFPFLVGTYDASSLTNAKDSTRFNRGARCKIDYSAITWPSYFSSLANTYPLVGNYITFSNLFWSAPNQANQLTALICNFSGTNLNLDNCVSDGGQILIQYAVPNFYPLAPLGGGLLTSSGTTCTITSAAIATMVSNGVTTFTISGAAQSAYNGTFTLTYVNATTVTYTALSTPSASPATGTIYTTAPMASVPDSQLLNNVLLNNSGFAYCAGFGSSPSAGASKTQNVYMHNVRRVRTFNTVHHHGGWKRGAIRSPVPSVPSSITSSSTTATVNLTGIGTLVSGGQTQWVISGATPAAFNGTYTLTASGADAATYTFAGASNASASVVGSMYAQNGTAAVGVWKTLSTTAVTQASQTGGVATLLTASTGSLAIGKWVSVSVPTGSGSTGTGGTGSLQGVFQVTAVVPNTSFSFNCDPRITGTVTSGTMTWGDAESNGWLASEGDPPNVFNHCWYLDDSCDDVKMYDQVISWDCGNAKLVGGDYLIDGLFEFRNPMAPIIAANSNDPSGNLWPTLATTTIKNHTQVNSDDLSYVTSGFRGWAPYTQKHLNYISALLVNQDNPSTSNRNGLQFQQLSTNSTVLVATVSDNILGFTPTHTAATGVTIAFNRNITEDAAGVITAMNSLGAGNVAATSAQAAFQTAYAATKALNVHTTFRQATPELAGVTVGATDLQTEQNVGDYMFMHPEIDWYTKLTRHFRQYVGR